jgi:hypothetical protein
MTVDTTAKDTSADTTTAKVSTADTGKVMRAAAVITENKNLEKSI